MSDKSQIQWTDATWNPTTGCTKVSPGCAHCYIERTPAFRIKGRNFVKGHIPLMLHEDRLTQPSRWRNPRRVFVNSLSDLFHDDVPSLFIGRVLNVMAAEPRHQFQVLTKRPQRMRDVLRAYYGDSGYGPIPNVWLGVSVENQRFANERIPLLLDTPAAVRFISAEPLLDAVELADPAICDRLGGYISFLDWVIVGGESGPKSRRFNWNWARHIVEQCKAAGVPCFVKQLGTHCIQKTFSDRKGGDPLEWPEDLRVREFPA